MAAEIEAAPALAAVVIGLCVECKTAFRVEIPAGVAVFPASLRAAVRLAGHAVWHNCRAGVRCQESPLGLPACGDSFCTGHPQSEIKFRVLRVIYKAEAVCGPGNCWGAKSTTCTCSCRGKNDGGMWAL